MSTLLFLALIYAAYRFGHSRGEKREAKRKVTYVVVQQRRDVEIPDSLEGMAP